MSLIVSPACNFVYLNAVPTEMLTGPCAVQRAVTCTLQEAPASLTVAVVNMKVTLKGVTLTDTQRRYKSQVWFGVGLWFLLQPLTC